MHISWDFDKNFEKSISWFSLKFQQFLLHSLFDVPPPCSCCYFALAHPSLSFLFLFVTLYSLCVSLFSFSLFPLPFLFAFLFPTLSLSLTFYPSASLLLWLSLFFYSSFCFICSLFSLCMEMQYAWYTCVRSDAESQSRLPLGLNQALT